MKKGLEIISYLALVAIVAAPVMYFNDKIDDGMNKKIMMIATLVWFATASFWIGTKKEEG